MTTETFVINRALMLIYTPVFYRTDIGEVRIGRILEFAIDDINSWRFISVTILGLKIQLKIKKGQ